MVFVVELVPGVVGGGVVGERVVVVEVLDVVLGQMYKVCYHSGHATVPLRAVH